MHTTSEAAAEHLVRLRQRRPLVHNITNYVAMDISANVLLAAGASPAMVHAVEEVEDFVQVSDALVLNIGTLSPSWVEAMHRASDRARALGKPIVLDPVGVGATPYRTKVAAELARAGVTAVRANASEILALAGATDAAPKGVDSSHEVDEALDAAKQLASDLGAVVAVTGPDDRVTDGETVLRVGGGSSLMAQVTAMGCACTAMTAAFLAASEAETPPAQSVAHALAFFGVAGTQAHRVSSGPASFRAAFIDTLANLQPVDLERGAQIYL